MKPHINPTRNQTQIIYKAVYELVNILYDLMDCYDNPDRSEDCETLEELLKEMRL